jgi:hypothetical protein
MRFASPQTSWRRVNCVLPVLVVDVILVDDTDCFYDLMFPISMYWLMGWIKMKWNDSYSGRWLWQVQVNQWTYWRQLCVCVCVCGWGGVGEYGCFNFKENQWTVVYPCITRRQRTKIWITSKCIPQYLLDTALVYLATALVNNSTEELVPYDAVNRNKVSIRQLLLFIFLLTHYMIRPLRAIFRWGIQLDVFKDYFYYNGSVARTQLDV